MTPPPDRPRDSSPPLSPAAFYILMALTDSELHGYAIMRDVAASTDGAVRLGPGTLYRVVAALLGDGLIEEAAPKHPSVDDARRRYYRLTLRGRRVLSEEARRMAAAVDAARSKRILAPRRT